MKRVTTYQADDGVTFTTEKECRRYEARCSVRSWVRAEGINSRSSDVAGSIIDGVDSLIHALWPLVSADTKRTLAR